MGHFKVVKTRQEVQDSAQRSPTHLHVLLPQGVMHSGFGAGTGSAPQVPRLHGARWPGSHGRDSSRKIMGEQGVDRCTDRQQPQVGPGGLALSLQGPATQRFIHIPSHETKGGSFLRGKKAPGAGQTGGNAILDELR